jgi:sugar/nucleoside kinase (ribokinase family)
MAEVVCIGNIVADAIARTVDRFPEPGGLVVFDSLTLTTGGNGLNVAIDLGRLGVAAALLGRAGRDAFGDFVLAEAAAAGVDVSGVVRDPSAGTGVTFVAVTARGERSFTHTPAANARLVRGDLDMAAVRSARALLVSSFVTPGLDGPDAAAVIAEARAAGVLTAWDAVANPRADAWSLAAPVLPHLDWCLPSEAEARMMVPDAAGDPAAIARRLQSAGARAVCIKLAERGCLLLEPCGRMSHIPARPVDPVVDATGAGDAWVAGFLTGLLRGCGPRRAAELAHAVAADCIRAVGASTGVRRWEQVVADAERTAPPSQPGPS